MKSIAAITIIAALVIADATFRGRPVRAQRSQQQVDEKVQEPKDKDKESAWMKYKLDASQKILEGLTRGDLRLIEKNARGMINVGHLEGWAHADEPTYVSHLHAFRQANRDLVRASQEKNLDAAMVAFSQLTISCMQCHRFVRDMS